MSRTTERTTCFFGMHNLACRKQPLNQGWNGNAPKKQHWWKPTTNTMTTTGTFWRTCKLLDMQQRRCRNQLTMQKGLHHPTQSTPNWKKAQATCRMQTAPPTTATGLPTSLWPTRTAELRQSPDLSLNYLVCSKRRTAHWVCSLSMLKADDRSLSMLKAEDRSLGICSKRKAAHWACSKRRTAHRACSKRKTAHQQWSKRKTAHWRCSKRMTAHRIYSERKTAHWG